MTPNQLPGAQQERRPVLRFQCSGMLNFMGEFLDSLLSFLFHDALYFCVLRYLGCGSVRSRPADIRCTKNLKFRAVRLYRFFQANHHFHYILRHLTGTLVCDGSKAIDTMWSIAKRHARVASLIRRFGLLYTSSFQPKGFQHFSKLTDSGHVEHMTNAHLETIRNT